MASLIQVNACPGASAVAVGGLALCGLGVNF